MNSEDTDLDASYCLMANLFLASSSIYPFGVGDLEDVAMPRYSSIVACSSTSVVGWKSGNFITYFACVASYHQSRELGVVPLEDVEGDDYLLD